MRSCTSKRTKQESSVGAVVSVSKIRLGSLLRTLPQLFGHSKPCCQAILPLLAGSSLRALSGEHDQSWLPVVTIPTPRTRYVWYGSTPNAIAFGGLGLSHVLPKQADSGYSMHW